MFVFVRRAMKLNLAAKLIIVFCLCLVVLLAFTACRDKEIYAESSDFESYPEFWNDFNDGSTGDIFIPDPEISSAITSGDDSGSESSNTSSSGDEISSNTATESEDYTANFGDDDEEENTSSSVDTDNDGTPDITDPDDDNDGTPDTEDPDDDGDGTPDKDEGNYGNQGPIYLF